MSNNPVKAMLAYRKNLYVEIKDAEDIYRISFNLSIFFGLSTCLIGVGGSCIGGFLLSNKTIAIMYWYLLIFLTLMGIGGVIAFIILYHYKVKCKIKKLKESSKEVIITTEN